MTEQTEREELERQILVMREAGASWADIQQRYDLTRQQARYAYQRGKRYERRRAKRA